jgi:hypothetical protein
VIGSDAAVIYSLVETCRLNGINLESIDAVPKISGRGRARWRQVFMRQPLGGYPFTSPRQAGSGMVTWGMPLRARASRMVMYSHGSMHWCTDAIVAPADGIR